MARLMLAVPATISLLALAAPAGAQTPILNEELKLVAADPAAGDLFGRSVAMSGDVAVIGASGNDDAGLSEGAVYVYRFDGTAWIEEAKLFASDAGVGGNLVNGVQFGISVAIADDVIVVGAFGDDGAEADSGSVYIFRFDGAAWNEEAKLVAWDAAAGDQFGAPVSIDGDTVVVGALLDDDSGRDSGSAYAFRFDGTDWIGQGKLVASDAAAGDHFGVSISIRGNVTIVGANFDEAPGLSISTNSGAAYVFRFDGASWIEEAKLTPGDVAAGDAFGQTVSNSGELILVGSIRGDGAVANSGAAYVYRFDGAVWNQEAKLWAADGASSDLFGDAVLVCDDLVMIGAPSSDGAVTDSGSAYVFRFDGAAWNPEAKLVATDGASGDFFGRAIAGCDGVLIAAQNDDDGGLNAGSIYAFSLVTTPVDAPPTAVAGADQSIHAGTLVTLDGSASFDDNTPTSELIYEWSLVKPAGSASVLGDAASGTPTFFADLPGTYIVSLIVRDGLGQASALDEIIVSSFNQAPTADAGSDQMVIVGDLLTLSGVLSSDPEMDPLTYQWTLIQAPPGSTVGIAGDQNLVCLLQPDLPGSYILTLVVDDGLGPSPADTVLVTAITGRQFAENAVMTAAAIAAALPPASVTTTGNQNAFGNFLRHAIDALQSDDLDAARHWLNKAIERADGCALRGTPDPSGPGRDWFVDCPSQLDIYVQLVAALDAISP